MSDINIPNDGICETTYSDGKIAGRVNYKDGKKHGWAIAYHKNGTKASEGLYLDGVQQGIWTYRDDKGCLCSIANVKDGKACGSIIFWDTDAGKASEVSPSMLKLISDERIETTYDIVNMALEEKTK